MIKKIRFRILAVILTLTLALTLFACGSAKLPEGASPNDILTFSNNVEDKPIIRIGTQYYTPDTMLIDTLQERFPDYLFVLDYSTAAGVRSEEYILQSLKDGAYYDLLISGSLNTVRESKPDIIVDLSAESFLDNYLLSSLNDVSIDGHVYSVPGTSTLSGIAFNVDMFEEHGWEIPASQDEFFALCEDIKEAGIAPFSTNFKYISQVNRLLTAMCYSELFGTKEGAQWLESMQRNEADYKGRMEPMFELVERFAASGAITADDFTASLTKQRQAFWAGEYAMIDYDSVIYTYAESESASFELGIMPYPAAKAEDSGFSVKTEYYIAIPSCVEEDPERLKLMKEILAFISTTEGQQSILTDSLHMSSVKGVDLSDNPAAKYAEEAYSRGNLFPVVEYIGSDLPVMTLMQTAALAIIEGGTAKDAVAIMDSGIDEAFASPKEPEAEAYEVIASADEAFTVLETSYYIADKLREAADTDVALMINRGFFRSNLAAIDAGDITSNMDRYVMKGVGAEDHLTVYKMTGAQLRELLDHPKVNGEEIDVFIAASGLKIEYAPWNGRGSRIIRLTLEDGKELENGGSYTVAAWAGVIPEEYVTEVLSTHDTLGTLTDILLEAFKRDGEISPDIEKRVKLIWPKPEER